MRNVFTYEMGIRGDPSIGSQRGPGTNQKRRKQRGRSRKVDEGRGKGRVGEGKRGIEKRPCDQESQLPTLAQVHPVEHIFPT